MRAIVAGLSVFVLASLLAAGSWRQLARSERASGERQVTVRLLASAHDLETEVRRLAELAELATAVAAMPQEERTSLLRRRLAGAPTAEIVQLHPAPESAGPPAEVYRTSDASDDPEPPIALDPPRLAAGELRLVGPEQASNGELFVAVWSASANGAMAGAGERWATLRSAAGLDELASEGYELRLTRGDPGGVTTLARSSRLPFESLGELEIDLPGDEAWTLALAPPGGTPTRAPVIGIFGFVLSLVLGLIAFALARKPRAIERQHAEELRFAAEEREQLMRRVAQFEREDERLRHEFFNDPPTGLPTRAYLLTRLDGALESVRRDPRRSLSLILVELGELRRLADALGSRAADAILHGAAQRITGCLGEQDLAARMSPDEFAVLVSGRRGEGAALTVGRALQSALSAPFDVAGEPIYARAAFGIAHSDQGLERAAELLSNADLALRRSRTAGGGELAEYAAALRQQAVSEQLLESDLRAALERGELEPYFQPIVDLEAGSLVGFEALVRWNHPQEGFVSPGRFLPLAEDSGLVVEVDRLMLRRVCEQTRVWLVSGAPRDLYVSVNLSGRHLLESDVAAHVGEVLESSRLPPEHLRLEITESALIGNFAGALEQTRRLKAMGLKLLLDDFGTGYSSLSYLHRFEFDVMKVDGSFVRAMTAGGVHRDIVRTVLTLSRDLGMSAVAEGIEEGDQRTALLDLGCPYGQGYLFGAPLSSTQASARLVS